MFGLSRSFTFIHPHDLTRFRMMILIDATVRQRLLGEFESSRVETAPYGPPTLSVKFFPARVQQNFIIVTSKASIFSPGTDQDFIT